MAVHKANLGGVGLPNGRPFPLVGLSIGDGMMDPRSQVPGYGSLLFGLSLIDEKQRDYMTSVEKEIIALVDQQRWIDAFRLFDPLMMSDIFPYPSYFTNVTGFTDYFNFDTPSYPPNPFEEYLNRADVKAALHVAPNFHYSSGNGTVEEYLLADWMQSVQPIVATLLDNYPVLMYNGATIYADMHAAAVGPAPSIQSEAGWRRRVAHSSAPLCLCGLSLCLPSPPPPPLPLLLCVP